MIICLILFILQAWKQWSLGTPLKVLDPSIGDSYLRNEVIRCLHIGLLCVQENPADRPTMPSIVLMLNNYNDTPQMPKEPAFFLQRRIERPDSGLESDQFNSRFMPLSINEVSITTVSPRWRAQFSIPRGDLWASINSAHHMIWYKEFFHVCPSISI